MKYYVEQAFRSAAGGRPESLPHIKSYAVNAAREITRLYESIVPVMDVLCLHTCRFCPDPCCLHACVRLDEKDLLFLHLTGRPIPSKQLINNRTIPCPCAGHQGCRIPDRLSRPWICAWYICPPQKRILQSRFPQEYDNITSAFAGIKQGRRQMADYSKLFLNSRNASRNCSSSD